MHCIPKTTYNTNHQSKKNDYNGRKNDKSTKKEAVSSWKRAMNEARPLSKSSVAHHRTGSCYCITLIIPQRAIRWIGEGVRENFRFHASHGERRGGVRAPIQPPTDNGNIYLFDLCFTKYSVFHLKDDFQSSVENPRNPGIKTLICGICKH